MIHDTNSFAPLECCSSPLWAVELCKTYSNTAKRSGTELRCTLGSSVTLQTMQKPYVLYGFCNVRSVPLLPKVHRGSVSLLLHCVIEFCSVPLPTKVNCSILADQRTRMVHHSPIPPMDQVIGHVCPLIYSSSPYLVRSSGTADTVMNIIK